MPNSKHKRALWLDPYGKDDISAQYVYMPLHEAGSSAGKVKRFSNISALDSELTLPAGSENYASNRGRLTADGSSYIVDKTQAFATFADWWSTTNTVQQMLMVFDLNFGAGTPSNNYVFSMSAAVTAPSGGYGLTAVSGTNLLGKVNNAGTVSDVGTSIQPAAASTEYRYVLLWDGINMLLHQYRNATGGTAKVIPTLPSAISASYGCSFMGRSTTTSPGNLFRSGDMMGNILMLKPRSDLSADIAAIAADVQKYPNELGIILRGM